jgi:succinate-acetate transporter protein
MASYDAADQLEKSNAAHSEAERIQRVRTKGGHEDDRTQPALPIVHRSFANPAPLGLLSFATGAAPFDANENSS